MEFNGEIDSFILQWSLTSVIGWLFALYYGYRTLVKGAKGITRLFFYSTLISAVGTMLLSLPFYLTTSNEALNLTVAFAFLFLRGAQYTTAFIAYSYGPLSLKTKRILLGIWSVFWVAAFISDLIFFSRNDVIRADGSFGWEGPFIVGVLTAISTLPFAALGVTLIYLSREAERFWVHLAYVLFGSYLVMVTLFTSSELLLTSSIGSSAFQAVRIVATFATALISVIIVTVNEFRKSSRSLRQGS